MEIEHGKQRQKQVGAKPGTRPIGLLCQVVFAVLASYAVGVVSVVPVFASRERQSPARSLVACRRSLSSL